MFLKLLIVEMSIETFNQRKQFALFFTAGIRRQLAEVNAAVDDECFSGSEPRIGADEKEDQRLRDPGGHHYLPVARDRVFHVCRFHRIPVDRPAGRQSVAWPAVGTGLSDYCGPDLVPLRLFSR